MDTSLTLGACSATGFAESNSAACCQGLAEAAAQETAMWVDRTRTSTSQAFPQATVKAQKQQTETS